MRLLMCFVMARWLSACWKSDSSDSSDSTLLKFPYAFTWEKLRKVVSLLSLLSLVKL
jgi:hypothetical protein